MCFFCIVDASPLVQIMLKLRCCWAGNGVSHHEACGTAHNVQLHALYGEPCSMLI